MWMYKIDENTWKLFRNHLSFAGGGRNWKIKNCQATLITGKPIIFFWSISTDKDISYLSNDKKNFAATKNIINNKNKMHLKAWALISLKISHRKFVFWYFGPFFGSCHIFFKQNVVILKYESWLNGNLNIPDYGGWLNGNFNFPYWYLY